MSIALHVHAHAHAHVRIERSMPSMRGDKDLTLTNSLFTVFSAGPVCGIRLVCRCVVLTGAIDKARRRRAERGAASGAHGTHCIASIWSWWS